jgi:hypothetical protein
MIFAETIDLVLSGKKCCTTRLFHEGWGGRKGSEEVSDTPAAADDSMKLLDAGFIILLRKNDMGSYTAVACKPDEGVAEAMDDDRRITDDFTPSQALYRLTEKYYGRIA